MPNFKKIFMIEGDRDPVLTDIRALSLVRAHKRKGLEIAISAYDEELTSLQAYCASERLPLVSIYGSQPSNIALEIIAALNKQPLVEYAVCIYSPDNLPKKEIIASRGWEVLLQTW
jgi:hypothetical protein